MLLTDDLIDELHAFRVGLMEQSIAPIQSVLPAAKGQAIGGGFARFAGEGSPMTQVYGVGHRGAKLDLSEIDAFFHGLATNWELIVTPFTPTAILRAASSAGYVPDHFETVLGQLAPAAEPTSSNGIQIEEIQGGSDLLNQVQEAGWSEIEELPESISEWTRVIAALPARRYFGRLNGAPAASASLITFQGMHLFAGACTMPQFRRRGLQQALTQRRLADVGEGAFVQVVALPGSQSHRNLQRIGFQPLYSKLVLYRTE